MKFVNIGGLRNSYNNFFKKIVTGGKETEVFNTAGGTTDLAPIIKKTKYIKKERRNFFHKRVPIPLCHNKDGSYNPQINGRYDDWYYSNEPVFRIRKGKKFRLFVGYITYHIEDFKEVDLECLTYWNKNSLLRDNLIEKSGNALICNKDSEYLVHPYYAYICFTMFVDTKINEIIHDKNLVHIRQTDYEISTDTYYIYIDFDTQFHPTPWNKNLKWVGDKIECILPTSREDIKKVLHFEEENWYICNKDVIIRYYKKHRRKLSGKRLLKLAKKRMLGYGTLYKLRSKTIVATSQYHHYNKQPSKFVLRRTKKNAVSELAKNIKRIE